MNRAAAEATNVWLIRHGETAPASRGLCYGSLDVPLSPAGAAQIEALAIRLPKSELSAIYCSPRIRCRHSAEILAAQQGCPVITVDALAELNFGDFEGKTYDEIAVRHPYVYRLWMERPAEVQFPGGESLSQMSTRVLTIMAELRRSCTGDHFGIVAHGGVNRIILADALCMRPETIFRIGQRYAALNLIRYYRDEPVVELMNG